MSKQKVLIIEDDPNIVRVLELELQHEEYLVEREYDGLFGLHRTQDESFDLILLDVMLPTINGLEVLWQSRMECQTSVILLTTHDSVMDKVHGLDEEAADYVIKPFVVEELLTRMWAVLRPAALQKGDTLAGTESLTINKNSRKIFCCGEPVSLTRREFDLLAYLVEHRNMVCSHDLLMEQVWGYDFCGQTSLVDVYIRYLRTRIDYCFYKEPIHTIRGAGYIIRL